MGIKRLIRGALNSAGYDLHQFLASESPWAQLSRLLSANRIDLVVDVGANIGQYAQQLRFLGYRGSILSFEPMHDAHALLERAADRDVLWQVAPQLCLGDREGMATLQISENGESNSVANVLPASTEVASQSRFVRSEEVPITTLDLYFRKHPLSTKAISMLKLDVQGFEHRVLAGAKEMLPRFQAIQCELSLVPLYAGQPLLDDMLALLRDLGFELHAMLPGFTDERSGRSLQMDGVFFRPNS